MMLGSLAGVLGLLCDPLTILIGVLTGAAIKAKRHVLLVAGIGAALYGVVGVLFNPMLSPISSLIDGLGIVLWAFISSMIAAAVRRRRVST